MNVMNRTFQIKYERTCNIEEETLQAKLFRPFFSLNTWTSTWNKEMVWSTQWDVMFLHWLAPTQQNLWLISDFLLNLLSFAPTKQDDFFFSVQTSLLKRLNKKSKIPFEKKIFVSNISTEQDQIPNLLQSSLPEINTVLAILNLKFLISSLITTLFFSTYILVSYLEERFQRNITK